LSDLKCINATESQI